MFLSFQIENNFFQSSFSCSFNTDPIVHGNAFKDQLLSYNLLWYNMYYSVLMYGNLQFVATFNIRETLLLPLMKGSWITGVVDVSLRGVRETHFLAKNPLDVWKPPMLKKAALV